MKQYLMNLLASLKQKLKAALTSVVQFLKGLGSGEKLLIVGVALLAILAKYRDVMMDLIAASGKKLINNSNAQDAKLAADEKKDNQQAQQLAQQSDAMPDSETKVTDDWNTKK